MTKSHWQMYGMLFFALACLIAPDAIREVQAAIGGPIPRAVQRCGITIQNNNHVCY